MTDGKIRVVRWLTEDELTDEICGDEDNNIGVMGGWFGRDKKQRWSDYIGVWVVDARPYIEALREEILRIGLKRGGDWHDKFGTPLFNDGKIGGFSWRGWGDLLAAVWSEAENKHYEYMDFYMDCGVSDKHPKEDIINGPASDDH